MHSNTTTGADMYELLARLLPRCRSLAGNGSRQSLTIFGEFLPLAIHEVASARA